MKIVEEFSIKKQADIIYGKHLLQTHFDKEKFIDESFFILAFMELATNLIKHSIGGKVLIFESNNLYLLGVADYGEGIQDLSKSMQKGYSTVKNSLGLGLHQLSKNELYNFEIFSVSEKLFHGTVILLTPKQLKSNIVFFSKPYINELNNGDFFAKKGKFLIFGDASGHNKKSKKTADLIVQKFFSTPLSCIIINEFFQTIHEELHSKEMRGATFAIVEVIKNNINICGVGDISLWYKKSKGLLLKSFKSGIIGEVFSSIAKFQITLKNEELIFITSDGIEQRKVEYFKSININKYSSNFIAFLIHHFAASKFDDSSIVILKN